MPNTAAPLAPKQPAEEPALATWPALRRAARALLLGRVRAPPACAASASARRLQCVDSAPPAGSEPLLPRVRALLARSCAPICCWRRSRQRAIDALLAPATTAQRRSSRRGATAAGRPPQRSSRERRRSIKRARSDGDVPCQRNGHPRRSQPPAAKPPPRSPKIPDLQVLSFKG